LVLFLLVSYATWYFLIRKEYVCHIDSTTGTRTTISVRWFEKSKHLDHGDFQGTCEELRTYVPDDEFENALIFWGYDDVMDDYVLTANINTVENLFFGEPGFFPEFEEVWNDVDDWTGIEGFMALKNLTIYHHPTNNLDLSNNIALVS